MRNALQENAKQAEALLKGYQDVLKSDQIRIIQAFVQAQGSSVFVRDYLYIKYRLLKYGFVRIAAQLLGL